MDYMAILVTQIIEFVIGITLLLLGIKQRNEEYDEVPYKPIKMKKTKYDNDAKKSLVGLSSLNLLGMFPWWFNKIIKIVLGLLFLYACFFADR
jgi:hypothetical protein